MGAEGTAGARKKEAQEGKETKEEKATEEADVFEGITDPIDLAYAMMSELQVWIAIGWATGRRGGKGGRRRGEGVVGPFLSSRSEWDVGCLGGGKGGGREAAPFLFSSRNEWDVGCSWRGEGGGGGSGAVLFFLKKRVGYRMFMEGGGREGG